MDLSIYHVYSTFTNSIKPQKRKNDDELQLCDTAKYLLSLLPDTAENDSKFVNTILPAVFGAENMRGDIRALRARICKGKEYKVIEGILIHNYSFLFPL